MICVHAKSGEEGMSGSGSHTLLVVGPGVLGTRIAQGWQQRGLGHVHGKTRSEATRDKLMSLSNGNEANDRLFSAVSVKYDMAKDAQLYRYVVFCAPPSGNEDYAQCVAEAADVVDWDNNGMA